MTRSQLYDEMCLKASALCIGLDPDGSKLPATIKNDPQGILDFCKEIIDATHDVCVAYKPNLAFFESLGPEGWKILEYLVKYIPSHLFTIADAKRGDIGNTSKMYAKAFFEHLNFDAVTVAPYMGEDSVTPFLEFNDKWVILLGLTSNKGSNDFQRLKLDNGSLVYEAVLQASSKWGSPENMMYVVGATHGEEIGHVRTLLPEHFFLVPGVGAQGGDAKTVISYGANDLGGLLINASRSILYASDKEDFAIKAREEAIRLNAEMSSLF
ncbi:MAG TPA: orotidine-5'-phosphate decarboxylase [Saprospiraceae bacterium]|nr:orotidine-5'-phosphate decarboxylase [Saprospiraceae bacterium]